MRKARGMARYEMIDESSFSLFGIRPASFDVMPSARIVMPTEVGMT
jgi:hypothetical protein